jgi:hypothetical protein
MSSSSEEEDTEVKREAIIRGLVWSSSEQEDEEEGVVRGKKMLPKTISWMTATMNMTPNSTRR